MLDLLNDPLFHKIISSRAPVPEKKETADHESQQYDDASNCSHNQDKRAARGSRLLRSSSSGRGIHRSENSGRNYSRPRLDVFQIGIGSSDRFYGDGMNNRNGRGRWLGELRWCANFENLLTLFATDCLAGQFIHQVDVCTATRTGNAEHGATPCRSPKIMGAIKPILIYRFGRWQQEFEHWPLIFCISR